jgi:hypothetical protein
MSNVRALIARAAETPTPKMATTSVSLAVALAVAAVVGFVGGYVFHATAGTELPAARQAVFEAQRTQRILDSLGPVVSNARLHKELSAVQSPADAQRLAAKYKEETLLGVERFEKQVNEFELPSERALAAPFLQEAQRIRGVVNAAP